MLSSNRKPTQPCAHGRWTANDRGLNQQGAEPQRGRWVGTMQRRVWQDDPVRRLRDGSQQRGGDGGDQKRRNRRRAGIMSRHGIAGTVFGTARIRIYVMRGRRLRGRAHTHRRTIARHGDVGCYRGQRAGIGRHSQLLEQQAKQHDPRPKDMATTADVKTLAHGGAILQQLEAGPVKWAPRAERSLSKKRFDRTWCIQGPQARIDPEGLPMMSFGIVHVPDGVWLYDLAAGEPTALPFPPIMNHALIALSSASAAEIIMTQRNPETKESPIARLITTVSW
jgi:hypothetical protein